MVIGMDNFNTSHYLLRWSDHIANYADMFLTLRDQEEFVDCSLACEDGVVGAHRLVLAGCSPYLRDLLKRSSTPHPIIFLVNVSRTTVLLLMEFIYRGQAHIPHNRLHQLVSLGKAMKIKGLSQMNIPEESTPVRPNIPRLHGSPDSVNDIRNYSTMQSERNGNVSCDESFIREEQSIPVSTLRGSIRRLELEKNVQDDSNTSIDASTQGMDITEDSIDSQKQNNNIPEVSEDTPSTSSGSEDGNESDRNVDDIDQSKAEQKSPQNTSETKKKESPGKALRSQDSPESSPRTTRNTSYIPKPKSKQDSSYEDASGSAKTSKEIKKRKREDLKAVTSKKGPKEKKKKPVLKERDKKVKPPVYKVKRGRPPKNAKGETKNKFNYGPYSRKRLGAYAFEHGMKAAQRHVLSKYGFNMRPKSIEKMTKFYVACVKKKEKMRQKKMASKKKAKK